jgi:hypothetical protein
MGIQHFEPNTMTYLDSKTGGETIMGRVRCGSCEACNGEPHEAVIHYIGGKDWWKYPTVSYCIFCGQRWYTTPEGFGKGTEFDVSVEELFAQHERDKRAGLY